VSADEANKHDTSRVVDSHNQSVAVALDVEDHAVVGHDAGTPILLLDLRWRVPTLMLDFAIPSQEWLLGVAMSLPELTKGLLGDDPLHWRNQALILRMATSQRVERGGCGTIATRSSMTPSGGRSQPSASRVCAQRRSHRGRIRTWNA